MNENVRLGYACVNMTLTGRPNKLGGRVTTSRTARKATWYPDNYQLIGERALLNATDLLHYLKWNNEHKIKLFRVGSKVKITPQMSKRYPGKILYTDHFTGKIGRVVENENLTCTNLVTIKFENIKLS